MRNEDFLRQHYARRQPLGASSWKVGAFGGRHPLPALAVIDAVRDETGELIGFAKITRDMTDREQARVTLADRDAGFRRLVDAVVDYAIFQIDPDGMS